MVSQGREERSWMYYNWWWDQEGIDLEGLRAAPGAVEEVLEE